MDQARIAKKMLNTNPREKKRRKVAKAKNKQKSFSGTIVPVH